MSNNADLIAEARDSRGTTVTLRRYIRALAEALEASERERDEARASEKDADAARNEHYERTSRTIENLRRERDDTKKRATEAEAEVVRLRSQRASHA